MEQLKIIEGVEKTKKPSSKNMKDDDLIKVLKDRITSEIVFVLTGPLCSGLSTVSAKLEQALKEHNYICYKIKISQFISQLGVGYPNIKNSDSHSYYERVKYLQDVGNAIRKDFKPYALAGLAIAEITRHRHEYVSKNGLNESGSGLEKHNLRLAYVIDSFKHPSEIQLLKQIYGSSLFVIGVDCPFDVAAKRAKSEKHTELNDFEEISSRDKQEPPSAQDPKGEVGQQTRKSILEADYFIRNDDSTGLADLEKQMNRFLELVTGTKIITPNRHETAMYMAYAAASKSACLSRQVGAVITNDSGQIISQGWNDVPVFGGGVYSADSLVDKRCFNKGGKCYNDHHKKEISKQIVEKIRGATSDKLDGVTDEKIEEALFATRLKDLIEFSRAIHAEMNAIVSVARTPNATTTGATLYCTTYPCHSCARHIVTAGIKEVIYIEPYAKSLATALHDDSITVVSGESDRVRFLPYEGVSPRRYLSFFEMRSDRKSKDGKLASASKDSSLPVSAIKVDHFYEHEQKVLVESKNVIEKLVEVTKQR